MKTIEDGIIFLEWENKEKERKNNIVKHSP